MPISVGDKIPSVTLKRLGDGGMEDVTTDSLFGGKTVVMFAVPGAFTPTCQNAHLPGFVAQADALKAKGVDTIICTGVNDPFVMKAWAAHTGADGKIEFLPDGNGELAKALDLTLDGSGFGLGLRSQRYAIVAKDGEVTALMVEDSPGTADASGADAVLKAI